MDYYSIIKQENYFAYSHEKFDKIKRYIRSLNGCFIKKNQSVSKSIIKPERFLSFSSCQS